MECVPFDLLPNSWWEYLNCAKDACTVVNHITGGRSSPGMQVLLSSIDQSIQEAFGRREFSLSPDILEYTTLRFPEELEVIFDTIARRTSLRGKIPIFDLVAFTSSG